MTGAGKAYLLSSVGADTLGLIELDLRAGTQRVVRHFTVTRPNKPQLHDR